MIMVFTKLKAKMRLKKLDKYIRRLRVQEETLNKEYMKQFQNGNETACNSILKQQMTNRSNINKCKEMHESLQQILTKRSVGKSDTSPFSENWEIFMESEVCIYM